MAWTAPRTYIAGEVHSAATLNTDHRDNLLALRGGGIAIAGAAAFDFIYKASATQLGRLAAVVKRYPRFKSDGTGWEMAIPTAGKHEIFIPAAGLASYNNVRAVTPLLINNMLCFALPFGPSAAEYAGMAYPLPKAWNGGTFTAQFYWANLAGGAGGVTWGAYDYAYSDGDAFTAASGSVAGIVTDAALAANVQAISGETGAITVGNSPADNDNHAFWFYRNPLDGGDTYASFVYLMGVKLRLVTDEERDD